MSTQPSNKTFTKSSYSTNNGNCLEWAELDDGLVAVRDSKDVDGPTLTFTNDEWHAFILGSKDGECDRKRS